MKSNNVQKGSRDAADRSADEALAVPSSLDLVGRDIPPPDQEGRRRLAGSYFIRLDRISPDSEQPRQSFDAKEMDVLEASIRARGIKQPLTVRWDDEGKTYCVIDGGRRFEAARRIGLEQVPCWIQQVEQRRDVLIDQVVHNWVRADLEPLETAVALARLRDDFGMSPSEIAVQIGKPRGEISKFLAIHDKTSDSVKDIAHASETPLTKRHLYNLSKLSAVQQRHVVERIRQEHLNAVQTEEVVANLLRDEAPTKKPVGFGARQRRFHTALADVLITFRKSSPSDEDLRAVLREILEGMG